MKQGTPSEFDGRHRGLSYTRLLPAGGARAGVVICHGAGSRKENHLDFARYCQQAGLAALCFDARGHGNSTGDFGPGAVEDISEMCRLLSPYADAVAVRGSSMGGFLAIQAAVRDGSIAAVIAICPAPPDGLLDGLDTLKASGVSVAETETRRWLRSATLTEASEKLGPRVGLMLCHAAGDERVPVAVSRAVYAAAKAPKRLVITSGGSHGALQHDPSTHRNSVEFIAEMAQRRREGSSARESKMAFTPQD